MTHTSDSNGNLDPLDAVVAEYLQHVEAGTAPDRAAMIAAHPKLADGLREFFADLDRMGAQGESFRLPDVTLPEDFGDYEILGEIGRGGMGVVYRARQKSLNRTVALKMILSGPLADATALRRFREEAETVSRLDHPSIVGVYEVGEHRGLPYFTMRLIEGQSLTRCLDRYASDPRGVAELLVKVCDAVHHAHQRGVLHRDLKPGNILIDAKGEPYVTDFGLSRRVEEARTLTQSSAVLGTPEYMPPEQAAGVKDLTTAADVYGLGAILYALCAGEPPFRASTVYETIRRVVEELPVPPRKVRRGVPRDLETICLKCLEKEPAKRYASAESLAADLSRWLRGEPIAARPAGPLVRLTKWARRRPTAAALAVVSAASLLIVLGGGIYSAERITRQNRDLHGQAGELTTALGDVRNNEQALRTQQALLEENAKQLRKTVTDLRKNEYALELEQYRGKLVEAQRELAAGNKPKASQILDGCQWDLRNWEFDYLAECCQDKPTVVSVGDEPDAESRPDPRTREWPKETRSLAFTPDGKQLITTVRGQLTIFDTATGKAVRTIDEKRIWDAVALSPDGKLLACYDASAEQVVLLEFDSGKSIRSVSTGSVRGSGIGTPLNLFAKKALAFSPNSKRLLVGSTLLDLTTGSGLVLNYPLGGVTTRSDAWHDTVPFSPDGKLVALSFNPVNSDEKNQAAIWDAHTGEVRAWLKGDPNGFRCLAFSPAGDRVAVGGFRNAVEVFHSGSGERLFVCESPTGVHSVAFTRDGRRLIVGDASGAVQIWDACLGKEILSLPPIAKAGAIQSLAVSPDGSNLAAIIETGTRGQRVVIRRASQMPPPGVVVQPRIVYNAGFRFSFGLGGDRIVALQKDSNDPSELAVFDSRSGRELFRVPAARGGLVHPTERRVVLASRKTIDLDTGATVAEWPADAGPVGRGNPFAFYADRTSLTSDGKHLVHRTDDKGFSLYELVTGRPVATYHFPKDYSGSVLPLAYHSDGKRIFVPINDVEQGFYSIRGWKLLPPAPPQDDAGDEKGKIPAGRLEEITRFVGHSAAVSCVALSPDGLFLASGGDDRTVRIWDAESGKQLKVLDGRAWSARHLGFSPDSRYLFVGPGGANEPAELWRVGRWDQHAALTVNGQGGFDAFAFTSDSLTLRLLAGSRCFEWDVRSGKPTRPHRDVSFLKQPDQQQPAATLPQKENLP